MFAAKPERESAIRNMEADTMMSGAVAGVSASAAKMSAVFAANHGAASFRQYGVKSLYSCL